MAFTSLLPPSTTKPPHEASALGRYLTVIDFLSTTVAPPTWLLLGACVQCGLVLLLPLPYSLLPAVLLLLARFIDTLAMTYGLKTNRYMKGVILGKFSAQVRDREGGFSENAAEEKIVVLHLGAKSSHPFGFLHPEFIKLGDYFNKISDSADKGKVDNGFLGQSFWTSRDQAGGSNLVMISYWRSLEDLHQFAHGPVHREAWVWWEKTLREHDYLGINHEIYAADRGQWENIYLNFQPTGLGATTYLKRGDKLEGGVVADEWVSPIVAAGKGKLKTSSGRLGKAPGTKYDW